MGDRQAYDQEWLSEVGMATDLASAVAAFILAVESTSGVPIAMLDRIDDPQRFWVRSAAILCEKTQAYFCDTDMRFMTANTEPLGQSHIIEYRAGDGSTKRVCAVIPPMKEVEPYSVSEAFGSYAYGGPDSLPDPEWTSQWLTLYHVAHCLDTALSAQEEARAVAFATMGMHLLDGDVTFTPGINRSPARKMAVLTGFDQAWWAAGTSERILLEHWKDESVQKLWSQHRCQATAVAADSIDVERLPRDSAIAAQDSCWRDHGYGPVDQPARVTDANLWIWMFGSGGVGAPPYPWEPMKPFASMEAGAAYVLQTANSLAR